MASFPLATNKLLHHDSILDFKPKTGKSQEIEGSSYLSRHVFHNKLNAYTELVLCKSDSCFLGVVYKDTLHTSVPNICYIMNNNAWSFNKD